MFGARALILKGVEIWNHQPRLLRYSRSSIFATRESSTLSLPAPSPSIQSTQVGDSDVRQGFRSRLRLVRDGFAAPSSGPKKPFPLRARRRSYEINPKWILLDFLLRNEGDRLHEISAEGHPLRALARDTAVRPSSLLAYAILRDLVDLGEIDPAWACDLETKKQFEARIANNSTRKWLTSDLVSHWAWIALTKNPDTRARRFGRSTSPKPWLLFSLCLLHPRHRYASRDSLVYMVDHLMEWQARFSQHAALNPTTFHLDSNRFATAVELLVRKCLIFCPDLLPKVALVAADFIQSIPLLASRSAWTHGYKCQCHIFNKAIVALGEEPASERQRARELCWEAQKILLECSSTSRRQLTISRKSYRSIRIVMLSLKKTAMETKVAIRSSSSWPPYRKVWDGTDELRKPEDDLSRASKAGILMHEAGYSSDWDDEALTVLAGSFSGRPPTVQTKTLDFKLSNSPDTLWIARMSATRNAREAWGVFQSPPVPGMLPTSGVYAAMFAKLYAPLVDMAGIVPGDTARVFPVDNGNLSPFAIASLEPPDPQSLYERMLKQGIAPTGLCLKLLIHNARDMEEAMGFLRKSPYSFAAPVLGVSLESQCDYPLGNMIMSPKFDWMRRRLFNTPPGILAAWISALCRVRPDPLTGACYIRNAVSLARVYKFCMPPGSRYPAPLFREIGMWMGRGMEVGRRAGKHRAASNLHVFLVVYSHFSSAWKGVDERMFKAFCLVLKQTIRAFVFKSKARANEVFLEDVRVIRAALHSEAQSLESCCNGVVQEFKLLVQPLDKENTAPAILCPRPRFPLRTAKTLQGYMRALASLGNAEEMVRVVEWLFDSYEKGIIFPQDLLTPGGFEYEVLVDTLAYFDTVMDELGDSNAQRRLRERLQVLQEERECPWVLCEIKPSLRPSLDLDLTCGKVYKTLTGQWSLSSMTARETDAGTEDYRLEASDAEEETKGPEEKVATEVELQNESSL